MSDADDSLDRDVEVVDHTDETISAGDMMSGDSASDLSTTTDTNSTEVSDNTPEPQSDDTDDLTGNITSADAIDWPALWDEFGFDTPDAADSIIISSAQLTGALEASEQDIGGDIEGHISWAVENEVLVEKEAGYILQVMLA